MNLHVDDFGCSPDGRFLERVETTEGSAVLIDQDGRLRPTDVGKNIAIPGAADLSTRIVGMINLGDLTEVFMGGGGLLPKQLRGKLFKPGTSNQVPFDPDSHVGRRINVAGAGSSGDPLISTITAVIDEITIELAEASQTPVSNSTAILYREDCVTLADFARASVKGSTVALPGRMVNDAAMLVGGPALFSETAKFSTLDIDKEVTIPGAGLHVTTIASFQSNTKVTLAAAAPRKVSKQQADIWKTDSRPGFELLLASLESMEVEAAEVRFSPGVYDFKRSSTESVHALIRLLNKQNLTFRGAGPGVTILRLMPQQDLEHANTHVIETQDCMHLTFRDFSIHGAYLTTSKTNEQMHGLFLNQGSEDIVVEQVRVFQTAGDGIRFLGKAEELVPKKPANKVRNVRVEGCQFIQNKRTGLAFQRDVEFVSVRNCYIEMIPPSSDSCIDLEPTGNLAPGQIFVSPTDLLFDSNFLKHGTPAPAVSLSGLAGPDPARRIKFSNNEIAGGHIFCTDVNELTIQNNTVRVTPLDPLLRSPQRIPISVALGGESVVITGNLLVNDDPFTKVVVFLGGDRVVAHALVANNLCFNRNGNGIVCSSGHDVAIAGNMIVATNACNNGIAVRSQSSPVDGVSVRDNDITIQGDGEWKIGIHVSADPEPMGHITVSGNSIRGATTGVLFEDAAYEQPPVCALNRVADDVQFPLIGMPNLGFGMITGGATSTNGQAANSGSGRFIVGLGDPNNNIFGNIGDIFQSLNGAKIGKALWVKETGDNTNTGWVPK